MRFDPAHTQINPLSIAAVASVAWRMRAEDWREVTAVVALEDPDIWAQALVPASTFGAVATWRERPTAALGAVQVRPGVFTLWMFATPDWERVAISVSIWCRRVLERELRASPAHRVECQSLWDHHVAHRWLRSFGLRREAALPGYGKRGETFIQFARVAEHVHVRRRLAATAPGTSATAAGPGAAAAAACAAD